MGTDRFERGLIRDSSRINCVCFEDTEGVFLSVFKRAFYCYKFTGLSRQDGDGGYCHALQLHKYCSTNHGVRKILVCNKGVVVQAAC